MDEAARPRPARGARDRDAVVGLRQLGHALPRLPLARRRARRVDERIDDAALVHRLTGCCPSVALHIPWDRVDDWAALAPLRRGAGHPHRRDQPEPLRRRRLPARQPLPPGRGASARRRSTTAASASRSRSEVGSTDRSASGSPTARTTRARTTSRARYARLTDGLEQLYAALPPGMRLLVEYKFFEPAFYSTDLPDWGTAALVCRRLGPQAQVLVDTGHHPQGTNIEQIVALLLAEGLLGGFHFNNRKYADDDLIVGAIDPFELFRIMREIARAARRRGAIALHDRPVAQRRGQDRRDDPVGAEHPDRVREGAARRRGAARGGAGARATCSARTGSCSRRSRPTCGRCSRGCASGSASRPTRSRRSARGGYAERLAARARHGSVESAYEQL